MNVVLRADPCSRLSAYTSAHVVLRTLIGCGKHEGDGLSSNYLFAIDFYLTTSLLAQRTPRARTLLTATSSLPPTGCLQAGCIGSFEWEAGVPPCSAPIDQATTHRRRRKSNTDTSVFPPERNSAARHPSPAYRQRHPSGLWGDGNKCKSSDDNASTHIWVMSFAQRDIVHSISNTQRLLSQNRSPLYTCAQERCHDQMFGS